MSYFLNCCTLRPLPVNGCCFNYVVCDKNTETCHKSSAIFAFPIASNSRSLIWSLLSSRNHWPLIVRWSDAKDSQLVMKASIHIVNTGVFWQICATSLRRATESEISWAYSTGSAANSSLFFPKSDKLALLRERSVSRQACPALQKQVRRPTSSKLPE